MMRSRPFLHHKRPQGVALIIILALLVLIAGLIVGFMRRMGTERTTSAAYAEANRNALLADHAVNLVQAQIAAATKQKLAWASQPGMVRTFKADGDLSLAYKLYSDSAMVSTSVDAAAALTSMNNWSDAPATFVDLNAPIFRNPDGATLTDKDAIYPILDSRAATIGASGGVAGIKGFEIASTVPGKTTEQPAPMPVRWLYILEDGTTVAPTGTGKSVTVAGATASNPIVGRIAFWTDDEAAKLNINTAGTGGFWDLPRAFAVEERDRMARFQPTLREFQRYPGHPATTSLWPALGYLFATESQFDEFTLGVEGASAPGLSPRLRNGGSLDGTRSAASPLTLISPAPRLYTSVDELLFDPDRAKHTPLERSDLEALKFFLTARSNAPEVSLFNLPRMAIWPINSGSKTPSTLDQLIAFCSTINTIPYYFARSNPNSGTDDATPQNTSLHSYITKLLGTPFPGFGTNSFADKYTSGEVDQITTMIFDYIRSSNLHSTALGASAYSGSSATSNPLADGSRVGQVTPLKIGDTKGIGRIPVLSKAVLQFYIDGFTSNKGAISGASMAPSVTPNYSADIASVTSYTTVKNFFVNTGANQPVQPTMRAIVYFDTFDPMYGYIFPRYNFNVEVEFSGGWTVNSTPLGFPSGTQTLQINRDHTGSPYDAKENKTRSVWMGNYLGGNLRPTWMLQNYSWLRGHLTNNSALNKGAYPLVSNSVQIHTPINLENATPTDPTSTIALPDGPSGSTMNFSGGTVTAKIVVNSEVIQTYTFTFDPFSKPAPDYPQRSLHGEGSVTAQVDSVFKQIAVSMDFRNRINQQTQLQRTLTTPPSTSVSHDYPDISLTPDIDTIVSLEPAYGDKRLLAGRSQLTTGSSPGGSVSFVPHVDYANASSKTAVDVRTDAWGSERYQRALRKNQKPGRILNIPYGMNAMPDVPRRYANGVTTNGTFPPDFDNGTLHQPDDAYVSRADEGSSFDLITAGTSKGGNRSFAWFWDEPTTKNAAGDSYFNSLTFYSPNKQISSAVMFGSLPTGVVRNRPWQTLLFRPDPGGHPGAASGMPKDHLLLDLFWMPVVEPYAISEPFSTNGKVNMNYQIMPFSYIHRSTAMQGVLHSQEITTIKNTDAYKNSVHGATQYGLNTTSLKGDEYKMYSEGTPTDISTINYRRRLNVSPTNGTLRSFEERFGANRLFVSETEICDVPLIPSDETWSANFESSYWDDRRLTGDNSREMPYAHLLPRLTTRSNTYTVHYWVQSLRKPKSAADQNIWDSTKDRVTSELRGSRTVERYIDPAEKDIPNYSTASDPLSLPTLEAFYRWRVLSNKEFRP